MRPQQLVCGCGGLCDSGHPCPMAKLVDVPAPKCPECGGEQSMMWDEWNYGEGILGAWCCGLCGYEM